MSAFSKRTIKAAGFGALAMAMAAPAWAPAWAEVDDLVKHALALEKEGKMADAYALLTPQLSARAGDPDFDYAYGIAAVDAGHGLDAILAFQRVLAVQPENAEARSEIARAYARMGDLESARAQFDTVLADPTIPDPVRQRFSRIVRDLDKVRGGGDTNVSGFVEASGGYDSNINVATSLNSITLPLLAFLGPATLSGTARSLDSGFLGASGGLSVRAPLSAQTALYVSALADGHFNTRMPDFDQISATGTAGIAHTLGNRDVVSLSGQYQQFWLGGSRYRSAAGVIGQYTFRLKEGRALSLAAQWYRLDYPTDPLRDADRFAASATFADRTTAITLAGGKEQTRNPASDNLSNAFVSLRGAIEKPLSQRLALVASAGVEGRFHDADDPLFLKPRRDAELDLSLGMKLLVAHNLTLRPGVSYTRNFSNIGLYDYRRFTASVAVRAEF